jgi:nucleoside-diphosphate-sugar epimerase
MSMKFCLLGGSGFIGTATHNHLISQGHEVFIVDIKKPNFHTLNFERVDLRIETPSSDASFFDCVVNLAAVHKNPGHQCSEYYETNVNSALMISDWIAKSPPQKFLHLSSIAVYGETKDWATEETSPMPISDYGKSKLMAERIFSKISTSERKFKTIIIRPGVIFGKGENGNFTRMLVAIARRHFVLPTKSPVHKTCGYVKELACFIEFLATSNVKYDKYNFSFKTPTYVDEITKELAELLGVSSPKTLSVPTISTRLRVLKILDSLAQRIQKLQISSCVLPNNMLNEDYEWEYDLRSSLSDWKKETNSFRNL